MVAAIAWCASFGLEFLLAEEDSTLPFYRLPPVLRAKVLAAFAGFIVLLIGALVLTWLGARVTRRYMWPTPRPSALPGQSPIHDDDWALKPLVPSPDAPSIDHHPLS